MSLDIWLAFIVTTGIMLIIPGPTVLLVVGHTMAQGAGVIVPLVAAVALGGITTIALAFAGLGAVLATSAFWFTVVKWAGGLYLLYLGIQLVRADYRSTSGSTELLGSASTVSPGALFFNTWLVTTLNPKGIVFLVAFLPQFIDTSRAVHTQLSILSATFIALSVSIATLYALFAARAVRLLSSPRAKRAFNWTGGGLLSVAGLWALTARQPV